MNTPYTCIVHINMDSIECGPIATVCRIQYVYMAHFIANQYNCCPSASVLKIWPNSNVRISFFSPATSTKSIHSFVYCCAYTHFLL